MVKGTLYWAQKALLRGKKITHSSFAARYFVFLQNGMLCNSDSETLCGLTFWLNCTGAEFEEGWRVFASPNPPTRKCRRSINLHDTDTCRCRRLRPYARSYYMGRWYAQMAMQSGSRRSKYRTERKRRIELFIKKAYRGELKADLRRKLSNYYESNRP